MDQKFIKITNKNEWQGLLDKVLFKTFFHNIEWEEFLEKQFKWLKFERYAYNNSALLSLARVGDKLISHPFCEYGGPLPLVENIDAEEFKRDLFSEFQNSIRISFHPYLAIDVKRSVLSTSGRVSYFVEGALDLRKTTRHEIEKAQRNNLQIEKCRNQKDLQSFYNLHIKSAKRHKIPAYPLSFFDYFANSAESEIILAKNNGKVIAGSVFLFYDKFVHYFQNAIDEKHKNMGANYLILWQQIQRCLQNNKVFDFGGTRIGSPLEVFKKGWGGKEYPIFELTNYGEAMKPGFPRRPGFETLRNAFGFLPPFLIKKLSPYLLKYKLR
ncbi:MAG: GNAT family N-acetyltransferase [Candidatus Nealsonbacteria bacterium]|nr:GNAT family N-acetyltransferase [Candidatus Nealsonbacteria bacterium]